MGPVTACSHLCQYPYDIMIFFSSRRLHTRCSRDWSSDVCSSDLGVVEAGLRVSALVEDLNVSGVDGVLVLEQVCLVLNLADQIVVVLESLEETGASLEQIKIGRASCRERV